MIFASIFVGIFCTTKLCNSVLHYTAPLAQPPFRKVRLTREFYSWLFTFGRGAKIVAPVEVADKMREYAENIAEMYKDDGEM